MDDASDSGGRSAVVRIRTADPATRLDLLRERSSRMLVRSTTISRDSSAGADLGERHASSTLRRACSRTCLGISARNGSQDLRGDGAGARSPARRPALGDARGRRAAVRGAARLGRRRRRCRSRSTASAASIDILAWHAASRSLLVIELKTELVDVQETVGTLDRKRRLAAQVAAERGWKPADRLVVAARRGQPRRTGVGPRRTGRCCARRTRSMDAGSCGWLRGAQRSDRGAVVPAFHVAERVPSGSSPRSGASGVARPSVRPGRSLVSGHRTSRADCVRRRVRRSPHWIVPVLTLARARLDGARRRIQATTGFWVPVVRRRMARSGSAVRSAGRARESHAVAWRDMTGPCGQRSPARRAIGARVRAHGAPGRDDGHPTGARRTRPPHCRTRDRGDGCAARPAACTSRSPHRGGGLGLKRGRRYGSSTSFVPWASDVAAVLKAFERSAEAPAVFGTQK